MLLALVLLAIFAVTSWVNTLLDLAKLRARIDDLEKR